MGGVKNKVMGGGGVHRDRPLIIHRVLSTPIEGENCSCEPESSHHTHPHHLTVFSVCCVAAKDVIELYCSFTCDSKFLTKSPSDAEQ